MNGRRLIVGLCAVAAAVFGGSFALGQATSSEPARSDAQVDPVSQARGDLRAASAQIDQLGGAASLPDLKGGRKDKRAGVSVVHAAAHPVVHHTVPHATPRSKSHRSAPSRKAVGHSTPVSSPRPAPKPKPSSPGSVPNPVNGLFDDSG
jgi:hypothetical protein